VARELVSGIGEVHMPRMLRAIPQEHVHVSWGGEVEVEDILTERES
jgi:hypothetical protein